MLITDFRSGTPVHLQVTVDRILYVQGVDRKWNKYTAVGFKIKFYLAHTIVIKFHAHYTHVGILTSETAGFVGV